MKISAKLIISFLCTAALALVVGIVGLSQMQALNARQEAMFVQYGNSQGYLGNIQADFLKWRMYVRDMIMEREPANVQTYVDKIKAAESDMTAQLAKYDEIDKAGHDTLVSAIGAYQDFRDRIVQLSQSGDFDAAFAVLRSKESTSATAAADKIMSDTVAVNMQAGTVEITSMKKAVAATQLIMILIIAAAVAGAALLGILIARSISRPLGRLVEGADRIAAGDMNVNLAIRNKDEVGILARAFESVLTAIRRLSQDAGMLAEAGAEGRLGTRADTAAHQGDYRRIVEGINRTLDAVIGPLNVAADYVERISKGDIPAKITDEYNGDFNKIKNNLNTCIDAVNLLVSDANTLVSAAVEGRLSTRADVSRHQGDFKKIVVGVNETLDAVIEPVQEAAAVLGEMSKGNLSVNVMGNYKGDHAAIKNALNDTINTIKGYIGEISDVLSEISSGNLRTGIDREYRGEFTKIKDSINNITDSLDSVLSEISVSAEQVASGTQQVSAGSQALSQGATEQASAIEELTASLTEIAGQTKQNAVSASQANELAQTARDSAIQGNERMQHMQKAMADINETSGSISRIIKVIDDIAFQTNLLALNAAVEAARAGQHGKGFAVVAEEVRNLAQRSAAAAKETTALIEESVRRASAGTVMADETANALTGIVTNVDKATEFIGGIARASSDQATAVSQINSGITQVSQVVQTNSATAEESAAASEELSGQASLLREMVGRFTLKEQRGSAGQYKAVAAKAPANGRRAAGKPVISMGNGDFGKY